jgi:CheY-like chemotaxis protein
MQVLFVEDDAMNRRVVHDMLSVVGASMDEAADAETGLRMIGEGAYDLVLMDLRMPGMDGLTAISNLRERSDAKSQLPVIVVTADTAIDLRERCLRTGADEVILKPVAMNLLLKTMSQVMSSTRSVAARRPGVAAHTAGVA